MESVKRRGHNVMFSLVVFHIPIAVYFGLYAALASREILPPVRGLVNGQPYVTRKIIVVRYLVHPNWNKDLAAFFRPVHWIDRELMRRDYWDWRKLSK